MHRSGRVIAAGRVSGCVCGAEYLKAFLKRLPDFYDEDAEHRALAYARSYPEFHQALAFLLDWPAHDQASGLVQARHEGIDGNHYGLLTPAADALEQGHPLTATLMLRAMIDFSLVQAVLALWPRSTAFADLRVSRQAHQGLRQAPCP